MAEKTTGSARSVNGIDLDQLLNTIEQVKGNPEIAKFEFRAAGTWDAGTRNHAVVKDFYGALKEHKSAEARRFAMDEPKVLCGTDTAANPVEYLLVALSGCMTTSMVAHAAARGIPIRGIRSRYEGEIDLRGFLGISEDVPVGFRNIRVYFDIDADLSDRQKDELVQMARKYSPVFNSIKRSSTVSVQLEPKPGKGEKPAA